MESSCKFHFWISIRALPRFGGYSNPEFWCGLISSYVINLAWLIEHKTRETEMDGMGKGSCYEDTERKGDWFALITS